MIVDCGQCCCLCWRSLIGRYVALIHSCTSCGVFSVICNSGDREDNYKIHNATSESWIWHSCYYLAMIIASYVTHTRRMRTLDDRNYASP